jgi:hypothetical protein
MKLALAFLSAAMASAVEVAPKASIEAGSPMGQALLSQARRLNNDQNQADYTWVAKMSLKFQGCYHTQTWNSDANGEDDVRVSTQRLVRFRLCPSDSCTATNAAGCDAGYGDYVIGMETYMKAYMDMVQRDHEYSCKVEEQYGDVVNCEDDYCKYDTYMAKGMEYCVDRNPYDEDNGNNNKNGNNRNEMMNKIAEGCQQFKVNNRRELEEEAKYYLGSYCSDSGGAIHVGLFTDDSCSTFADENNGADTFYSLALYEMPYATTTMIGTECVSCKEPKDVNQNNENDQYDADEVKESCEELYAGAGKCETQLSLEAPTTSACNFMEGIKIYRKNGSMITTKSTGTTASVFIGLFATSFILLGGYSYYLKTKLDRAKVNLADE